jgi:hypothetical protein
MAMTMRDARRLLVLALGVAGVALAAGAPGASAVQLQCDVSFDWTFSPPVTASAQTVTVTSRETLSNCTGTLGAFFGYGGTGTDTFTATGNCGGLTPVGIGSKTYAWASWFLSRFTYNQPVVGPGGWGAHAHAVDYTGAITDGFPQGRTVTEHLVLNVIGSNFLPQCISDNARVAGDSGRGTFTIQDI